MECADGTLSKKWSGLGEWTGLDTPKTVMTTRAPAVLMIFILTSSLACCHGHRPLDSLDAQERLGLVQSKASESAFGNKTPDQMQ